MSYEAHIKLADAVAIEGAPRCFKRLWDPAPSRQPNVFTMPGPIVIYGYASMSTFPEDHGLEKVAWADRRTFLATCFSAQFPDPEIGFVPADEVTEITEPELRTVALSLGVIV